MPLSDKSPLRSKREIVSEPLQPVTQRNSGQTEKTNNIVQAVQSLRLQKSTALEWLVQVLGQHHTSMRCACMQVQHFTAMQILRSTDPRQNNAHLPRAGQLARQATTNRCSPKNRDKLDIR